MAPGTTRYHSLRKASIYLEQGHNIVDLNDGFAKLLGSGGKDTVNIESGHNTVTSAYRISSDLVGNFVSAKLNIANKSSVNVAGDHDTVKLYGNRQDILLTGDDARILLFGSADTVQIAGGKTDTLKASDGRLSVSSSAKVGLDLNGANEKANLNLASGSTIKVTGSDISATISGNRETIILTGANERITLTGKNDTIINAGGGHDSISTKAPGASKHHSATVSSARVAGHDFKLPASPTLHGAASRLDGNLVSPNHMGAGTRSDHLIISHRNFHGVPVSETFKFDETASGGLQHSLFTDSPGIPANISSVEIRSQEPLGYAKIESSGEKLIGDNVAKLVDTIHNH